MSKLKRPDYLKTWIKKGHGSAPERELAQYVEQVEAAVKARETRLTNLAKKLYTHDCEKTHAKIGFNGDATVNCQLCEEKTRADQAMALEAAIFKAATKVKDIDWAKEDAPDQAHKIFMDALKTPQSEALQELTALVQSIFSAVHQSKVTEAETLGGIVDAVIPFAHLGERK